MFDDLSADELSSLIVRGVLVFLVGAVFVALLWTVG